MKRNLAHYKIYPKQAHAYMFVVTTVSIQTKQYQVTIYYDTFESRVISDETHSHFISDVKIAWFMVGSVEKSFVNVLHVYDFMVGFGGGLLHTWHRDKCQDTEIWTHENPLHVVFCFVEVYNLLNCPWLSIMRVWSKYNRITIVV